MTIALIRTLALISLILLKVFLTPKNFIVTTVIIGLSHYIIALVYSKNLFAHFFKTKHAPLKIFMLFALAASLMTWEFIPMFVYFGIHHFYSEVYSLRSHYKLNEISSWTKNFQNGFHFFFYCLFLKDVQFLQWIPYSLFVWGFVISAVWYFFHISNTNTPRQKDHMLSELPFVLMAFVIIQGQYSVLDVILYHFLFWSLFPLTKFVKIRSWQSLRYGLANFAFPLVLIVLFIQFSTTTQKAIGLLDAFGYFHISLTFGLSQLNPVFIKQIFWR